MTLSAMFGVSLRRFAAAETIAQLSARVQSSTRRGHVDKIIFGQGALSPSLHSAGYMCPALVKAHVSPLRLRLPAVQVVVLFDSDGSTEEPHIILELSMSCVRHARPRASSLQRKRASLRACAGRNARRKHTVL